MSKSGYGYEGQICGLRRRTFYISIIVVFIICAAAIGGGVGGGIAARNRNKSSDDSAQSPASTSSTPPEAPTSAAPSSESSTSSTPSKTSSGGPGSSPTAGLTLNNMTNPYSFAFQGFTKPNYQGNATRVFHHKGFYDLGMEVVSYVWDSNATCCTTFCVDRQESAGYRCEPWEREEASGAFKRIFVWCSEDVNIYHGRANETCSP